MANHPSYQQYSIFDPCIWKKGDFYYPVSGGQVFPSGACAPQRSEGVPEGEMSLLEMDVEVASMKAQNKNALELLAQLAHEHAELAPDMEQAMAPSGEPSVSPSDAPSMVPTIVPTLAPSGLPSEVPRDPL